MASLERRGGQYDAFACEVFEIRGIEIPAGTDWSVEPHVAASYDLSFLSTYIASAALATAEEVTDPLDVKVVSAASDVASVSTSLGIGNSWACDVSDPTHAGFDLDSRPDDSDQDTLEFRLETPFGATTQPMLVALLRVSIIIF